MATNINLPALPARCLLTFVLLLSVSFRLTCSHDARYKLAPTTRERIITFHALALESTQLVMAGRGLLHIRNITTSTNFQPLHLTKLDILVCIMWYTATILAVDMIESLVVLGGRMHHVQWQTFVLMRKVVWPALVRLCARTMGLNGVVVPRGGGKALLAKKTFGMGKVEKVILLQSSSSRRLSTGSTDDGSKTTIGPRWVDHELRRHSFPHEQLNTRPLLRDSRAIQSSCCRQGTTPIKKSHGQAAPPTAPRMIRFSNPDSSDDGRKRSREWRSTVRTIVTGIEDSRSR